MSGPYNYDYLIPEIKIPLENSDYAPGDSIDSADDWLSERFETLNCLMKNPYTGTECFSDNSSVITVLIGILNFHEIEGLENLPKDLIDGENLSEEHRETLICTDENGAWNLCIGPHYQPELWTEADKLITAANRAKQMFLDEDPRLIEPFRNEVDWAIRSLDLNDFLPPEQAMTDDENDGSMYIEENTKLDDRAAALIGASGFATIAIEAEKLKAQGAGKVAILTADQGLSFRPSKFGSQDQGISTQEEKKKGSAEPHRQSNTAKGGWLKRLFGPK